MARQIPLPLTPPLAPSLDNFVVGANRELLERLRAAAAGTLTEAVLYLWGGAGSGRSHLLRAAVQAAQGDRQSAVYLHADAGYALAASPRLVAADDVERLDEARQIALFSLINRARETGSVVIAAGSLPPARLALREDLRTRLAWGLVYRVHPIGDEDKAQQLRAEAARRGLRLSDEVASYLINRLPRDVASLSAVLDRLDRESLARQRPITIPLVRALLHESGD